MNYALSKTASRKNAYRVINKNLCLTARTKMRAALTECYFYNRRMANFAGQTCSAIYHQVFKHTPGLTINAPVGISGSAFVFDSEQKHFFYTFMKSDEFLASCFFDPPRRPEAGAKTAFIRINIPDPCDEPMIHECWLDHPIGIFFYFF